MSKTRITPLLAREWLLNPDLIPEDWTLIFNTPKRLRLVKSLSHGFPLECKEGEYVPGELTSKQFYWAHKAAKVRVNQPNPQKTTAQELLSSVQAKRFPKAVEISLALNLKEYIKTLSDWACTFMNEQEYRKFYKLNLPHTVDLCNDAFYLEFPNAGKK